MSSKASGDQAQDPIDARTLIEELRRLQARIPDFSILTNQQIVAMRKAAAVDRDWIVHTTAAVGACSSAQKALGSTDAEMRQELFDQGPWSTAESEAFVLFKGLAGANLVRRHRLGLRALQAYGIIRQLVRQPEHRGLLFHFEQLKELNRLGPRKKKSEDEPADETPTTTGS